MNWNDLIEQLRWFLGGSDQSALFSSADGLVLTRMLQCVPMVLGLVLSIPLAFARNAHNGWVSNPVRLYTFVLRGTPMLVQLFLVYYGLSQFELIRNSLFWDVLNDPYRCALLTFTLNTTAYTTEIVAGQLRNTDRREVEAAQSLGMSVRQVNFRIVLPAALRRSLPAYGNEVIMLLHGTAIVSLVTLSDLTGVARHIYADTYNPFQPFIIAGAFYLTLTWLLSKMFARMERRWLAYLMPSTPLSTQLSSRSNNSPTGPITT
jgi:arginine/ornithine transport system permease protein